MSNRKDGFVMNQFYNPSKVTWKNLIQRPTFTLDDHQVLVDEVFENVKNHGDEALLNYAKQFDKFELKEFAVNDSEISKAIRNIPKNLRKAIKNAKDNIHAFHKAQKTKRIKVETQEGVVCWQEKLPIEKIGLYIPSGSAPLFSTILMLATPATIAGCEEIILCSPPNSYGKIPDEVLFTASLCGIDKIFKIGGIQAIAAMTFGTESIPKVYKIFGPGNQYVTSAKQFATRYSVSIDMPAGPSELLVAADETADPDFVASDLLSQAEHGPDSQVVLVSTKKDFVEKVNKSISYQIDELQRNDIVKKALLNSKAIIFDNDKSAVDFINEYSPEHYIICVKNEDYYIKNVKNAGSVFIGNYTPESAGDYASGTNHTLPTNGYSKQYSGVNLDSFTKSVTFQKISKKGIQLLGETIEIMANAEGLQAHKNAVSIRLKKLENEK